MENRFEDTEAHGKTWIVFLQPVGQEMVVRLKQYVEVELYYAQYFFKAKIQKLMENYPTVSGPLQPHAYFALGLNHFLRTWVPKYFGL